jgi:hypothetical protein
MVLKRPARTWPMGPRPAYGRHGASTLWQISWWFWYLADVILIWDQIYLKPYQTSFPSSSHWPRSHSGWMSYGLPNEALLGCRWTDGSTLMNLHIETHLYLHSNNDMYMWNQVNYTKNHCANVGTSSPYNQCSYPKVTCPHHCPLRHQVIWEGRNPNHPQSSTIF